MDNLQGITPSRRTTKEFRRKKPDLARFLCFSFNFNAYLPAAGHQVKAAGERSEAQPEAKDKKKKRIKPR